MAAIDGPFFRHAYGALVASLVRRYGPGELAAIEDAVQCALERAVVAWRAGEPGKPLAWLHRVATNELLDVLRARRRHARILRRHGDALAPAHDEGPDVALAGELADDVLRLLFLCCDDAVPADAQLALALKTLCGFGVREIAQRLFASEAVVYKRIERARSRLQALSPRAAQLTPREVGKRLPRVQSILYLLFAEGHLSSHADHAIRHELCGEAIRLATCLAEHALGATAATFALLALMHLHAARLAAREDDAGELLLLEAQDRGRWDARHIELGLGWLARSATGVAISRYHAEAGIAAEHALAPSFAATNWARIVELYAVLEQIAPSPLFTLERALATAEWRGPAAGLAVLEGFDAPAWLRGHYRHAAVLADLHRRCGDDERAREHFARACAAAPTETVRRALRRRFEGSGAAPIAARAIEAAAPRQGETRRK